jgi:hypothetical protein
MSSTKTLATVVRVCTGVCLVVSGLLLPVAVRAQNGAWTFNPPPLFPTNEWGPVTNDCQIGLRFPKLEYQAGEQILAAVILRNVGDRQLGHLFWSPDQNYEVTVRRSGGQSVLGVIGGSVRGEDLPPHGQQYPHWVNLTERYKLDDLGTYIITLREHTGLTSRGAGGTNWVTTLDMFSNPVTITIVAPKPKQ